MQSLKASMHLLSDSSLQMQKLAQPALPRFEDRVAASGHDPFTSERIETLQVNVGKLCNQTCVHCHVDAGPDRREIMTRETMQLCLDALAATDIRKVDLTGGAPEMNPHFEWFVEEIARLGKEIMLRSNLTILTVHPKFKRLPGFFAGHGVTVVSSLPCYTAENTDRQRGEGVFERSIEALRMLNSVGYGRQGSGLRLHLVYNPLGASLPPPQGRLEADYRRILADEFGIVFNELYCITNMPISRFLDLLLRGGKYEQYMGLLVESFNPEAVGGVMCRSTLSVGWDGRLFDCDFNQMLELEVDHGAPRHIRAFDAGRLSRRRIVVNQHCYGCTAGAGSSCGGEIVR